MAPAPEGVLLIPILIVAYHRSWKKLTLSAVAFCLAVLPWVVFSVWYYGTPIPHSVIAKASPLYPLRPFAAVLRMVKHLHPVGFLTIGGLTIALGIALFRDLSQMRQRSHIWMPALFFWSLFTLYAMTNPLLFPWYWPALLVPAFLVVVCGAVALGEVFKWLLRKRYNKEPAERLNMAAKVLLVVLLAAYTLCPHLTLSAKERVTHHERLRRWDTVRWHVGSTSMQQKPTGLARRRSGLWALGFEVRCWTDVAW